ncbi:hypothetical protein MC885_009333 [Smutsia gigantea]|nr:hypothetical protein MC885_009333 [Smutsia gigantea]
MDPQNWIWFKTDNSTALLAPPSLGRWGSPVAQAGCQCCCGQWGLQGGSQHSSGTSAAPLGNARCAAGSLRHLPLRLQTTSCPRLPRSGPDPPQAPAPRGTLPALRGRPQETVQTEASIRRAQALLHAT